MNGNSDSQKYHELNILTVKITTDYQDIVDEKTVLNCWKDAFANL